MFGPCDECGRVRPCNGDRHCEECQQDVAVVVSKAAERERYLEYPFGGNKGFEHVSDMPKEAAEEWIDSVAEEAGLNSFYWDPRRAASGQSCLMNKGAVHVEMSKYGRKEIWIYNHDGQYSLIRRDAVE